MLYLFYLYIYIYIYIWYICINVFNNLTYFSYFGIVNGDNFQVHGTGHREMLLSYSFLSCIKYVLSLVNNL